jgi:hypothetical protein
MANNAGRQGAGANAQLNEHVEFTVKVRFWLYVITISVFFARWHCIEKLPCPLLILAFYRRD